MSEEAAVILNKLLPPGCTVEEAWFDEDGNAVGRFGGTLVRTMPTYSGRMVTIGSEEDE